MYYKNGSKPFDTPRVYVANSSYTKPTEEDEIESISNPSVLDELYKINPQLITDYKNRIAEKDAAIQDARDMQGYGDIANVAGQGLNDFNNSQKRDTVMYNRMQDLGKTPDIIKANRPEYKDMISPLTKRAVDQAYNDKSMARDDFKNDMALEEIQRNDSLNQRKEAEYQDLNNPNSEGSKQARDYLKQLVPTAESFPNFDKMSAAQVYKFAPSLLEKYKSDQAYKLGQIKANESSNNTNKLEQGAFNSYMGHQMVKDYNTVEASYFKLQNAVKDPSPAGDLSLIFSYMRMLDPGSTVREGEFANAQNAASVPDQVRNTYNKVVAGTRLNPDQRGDFLNQAKNLYNAQGQSKQKIENQYRDYLIRNGGDPNRAFGQSQPAQTQTNTNKNPNYFGEVVTQGGKVYKWNGQTYIEAEEK